MLLAASLASCATAQEPAALSTGNGLYLGADLSYVNEMEDCGAVYRAGGEQVDPFDYMAKRGGNLVRVRLWNDADWTPYSDFDDVAKTLKRAKAAGHATLLDFHYSDDWADGDKQIVPKAWAGLSTEAQAKALHDFTYDTLVRLHAEGLMPDWVQVGNETNGELMAGKTRAIDWRRNAALFNAGIRAVRAAGKATGTSPKVMLHIAQPENVMPWFDAATVAGVLDYDLIGISYYSKWSKWSLAQLGATIRAAKARYKADVVLVETAYPFSREGEDGSPDLLGPDTLIKGYPATPKGQLAYMTDLTELVVGNGGIGVVYWEPAWVSTGCKTRWGTGSNWENAAWFDLKDTEALPVFEFLGRSYRSAPPQ
ncbi:arabinogalactan endo-1,4-beta-galactosidase [Sphingomonas gilva]|uniref:Arabinogalactan endo-beta-1,4-galactanase n=1 Tax=Sphingomonas gilva TaxID=2305907 RepID=A0A396RUV5_9SPHN|nr:glycosyl hydrolase 53 family protein [Sphingomonas gilva]RHW17451.1 arabinogalactan endo-1,4-beta-galactosidase [Sphingomonas gilva]